MKRLDFWDVVAYTSISLALLWFILKATGVIKTATWLELFPFPLFIALLAALYVKTDKTHELAEPVEYRKTTLNQAMKEIEKYSSHKRDSFWMEDIIRDLRIEPKTVLEAVQELEKRKKIKPKKE
jgi:hypothetical protein